MVKQYKKLQKSLAKTGRGTGLEVFEGSCGLLRENWLFCAEAFFYYLVMALLGAGVGMGWWLMTGDWLGVGVIAIITSLGGGVVSVGKNKNMGFLLCDYPSGRYPLWSLSYLWAGAKIIWHKIWIYLPLIAGGMLSAFFVFVSPSTFWAIVCAGAAVMIEAWLFYRWGLVSVLLSCGREVKLVEARKMSQVVLSQSGGKI